LSSSALPGSWDGLVVVCATTPWRGHHLLDQTLARELSRHTPVLYVDPPVSVVGRLRNHGSAGAPPALQAIGPNLARLTPTAFPLHQRPGIKTLSLAGTRRALARAVTALGSPDVLAVIVPSLNPLFGACGERTKVFYAKDDYVAGARLMRIAPARLRRRDTRQPADADLVVAVSEVLADHYRAMGHHPLVIPNGCDVEHFAATDEVPPPPDLSLRTPVAGLIGTLGGRIDVSLLHAVVSADVSLLLVGGRPSPATDGLEPLIDEAQVSWVGPRPFEALPAYLQLMDVGLVPYTSSDPFNQASSPLKVLEYLAAGRPVVATDLPGIRALDTDLVTIAEGPEAFAAAVRDAAATAHDPTLVARRKAFAAAHGWSARLRPLISALGLTPAQPLASALTDEVVER